MSPSSPIIQLVNAAAYVRMSTSKQEDSPERQRHQINQYATRNGYRIVRWYEDHGMTGTESLKRANYQQMLADASSGAFEAVLMSEISRLSREDLWAVMPQWKTFRDAGVTLVSCLRGPLDFDSMGGFITAFIDQFASHDESRKIADRTVSGKMMKVRNGERVGGWKIFGYDRAVINPAGEIITKIPFSQNFHTPSGWSTKLVPTSDAKTIEAIRWAFQHVAKGGSMCSVANEFNRRGIRSARGFGFSQNKIRSIMTNHTYAGDTQVGHESRGKFAKLEPTLIKDTHQAIIDHATFETVSALMQTRSGAHDRWRSYILSGVAKCYGCGRNLTGGDWDGGYRYCCKRPDCDRGDAFNGPRLESAVLKSWASVFLQEGTQQQIAMKPVKAEFIQERKELETLEASITLASQNLARSQTQDEFSAVSDVLSQYKKRQQELRAVISKATRKKIDLAPDVAKAIKELGDMKELLDCWPEIGDTAEAKEFICRLSVVLKLTIQHVVPRQDVVQYTTKLGPDRGLVRLHSAVLTFNPEHTNAPPVEFTDDVLASPKKRTYRNMAAVLREIGKPQSIMDLMAHTGQRRSSVVHAVHMCEGEGLIKKTDAGWVAVELRHDE